MPPVKNQGWRSQRGATKVYSIYVTWAATGFQKSKPVRGIYECVPVDTGRG